MIHEAGGDEKRSVSPVTLGLELLGEILHLISQNALFSKVVPFVGIRSKWHCQQRHACFLWCLTIFEPVASLAGGDHVFPAV